MRKGKIRTFKTGATRDTNENKPDYEGFISPLVVVRFGKYMLKHQKQSDGSLRNSDNWQKGMPLSTYMKSLNRHFIDLRLLHRGYKVYDDKDGHELTVEEVCCAIRFNNDGYLHETLKEKNGK